GSPCVATGSDAVRDYFCAFFVRIGEPPSATLFPYTTLFRSMETDCGPVVLDRPDGSLATLSIQGQPKRAVALKRRDTAELIAEELRRLDPDDTYASALRYGVERLRTGGRAPAGAAPTAAAGDGPAKGGARAEAVPAPVGSAAKAPAAQATEEAPVKKAGAT